MEDSLEHLVQGETLAAVGAWDGLERRLAFAGVALQLLARLYPTPVKSRIHNQSRKGGPK
jgi:hypothetical protein